MAEIKNQPQIFMLGHSRGVQFTYAYANEETRRPRWEQSPRGIISVDIVYKLDPEEEELTNAACTVLGSAIPGGYNPLKSYIYFSAIRCWNLTSYLSLLMF